jgi:ELWxxDGT repeat protein
MTRYAAASPAAAFLRMLYQHMRSLAVLLALLAAVPALSRGLGGEPYETATTPQLLFFLRDGGQLWRTDGTAQGTWRIDTTGAQSISRLTVMNERLYFLARDARGRDLLYGTDGSRAPAELIARFDGLDVDGLGTNGSRLFFFTQTELIKTCLRMWTSDGTTAGTRVFNSLLTDEASSLAAAGGKLLFRHYPMQAFEWGGRSKYDVWATDGTVAGTTQLLESVPDDLHTLGDVVLFGERPLMRSDGTIAGTFPLATSGRVLGISGRTAIFVELDADGEYAIWTTDGTLDGTHRFGALPFLPSHAAMAGETVIAAGGEVWALEPSGARRELALRDLTFMHSFGAGVLLTNGSSIWRTDGTVSGTSLLSTPGGGVRTPFHQLGERAVFFASDGIHGIEPFVSDGTPAGTGMIANLIPEGTIRGRVTDLASGAPLTNVTIEVDRDYFGAFTVPVDANGRYEIEGVAGSVHLLARSTDHLSQPWGREPCRTCGPPLPVRVEAGQILEGIDFALPIGGAIAGRVVDEQGRPMANVTVRFSESLLAHAPYATAVTRGDGTYVSETLIPGRQLVAFIDASGYSRSIYDGVTCSAGCAVDAPTRVTVPDGATREGVDFTLYPWARLRGRILDAVTRKPVTLPVVIEGWLGWTFDTGPIVLGRSKPDGTYDVALRDGRYYVRASQTPANPAGDPPAVYLPSWYPNIPCTDCFAPRGEQIVPAPGAVIEHDFVLQPRGPRIGGTVTDAESGAPLASATVEIIRPNGSVAAAVRTAADGTYETPPSLDSAESWVRVKPFGSYLGAIVGPLVLAGNERRIVDLRLERAQAPLPLLGQ